MKKLGIAATLVCAVALIAKVGGASFAPGSRIQILAHNAYPDHGNYSDRLDRAIASGVPFVVEEDLAWVDGKSLLIHGAKNVASDYPTLESYFFPKVRPVIEKALRENDKKQWPVITLYLDIKNDPLEHLAAISKVLDQYGSWLTTAVKTDDPAKQSPLDLKPMMVLVEDKQGDSNKQEAFYDRVPVGGKIQVFGSVAKPDANPGKRLSKQEAIDRMIDVDPEQVTSQRADNYHRWWGVDWAYIEKGGETNGAPWTLEANSRLRKWVNYGHRLGYVMSVYCLDGYTADENQGWDKDYNFGSRDAVLPRWRAATAAAPDFISTDQYEQLAKLIRAKQ
ncbi:MAG TPA: hypothetical protein VHZ55_07780 [Bryobacteraceae bacterium]|jgi:hypothetical protein|nr:hypothetical protein [Bryobacteraceae bacterium]